jgi:hypothetical protein
LATELKLGKCGCKHIRLWAAKYSAYGCEAFDCSGKNAVYSKELKELIVKEYLDGRGSLNDLCINSTFKLDKEV